MLLIDNLLLYIDLSLVQYAGARVYKFKRISTVVDHTAQRHPVFVYKFKRISTVVDKKVLHGEPVPVYKFKRISTVVDTAQSASLRLGL